MNFGFSEEQDMLRASARRFFAAECPTTLVRRVMADGGGDAPALWPKLVELGWTGLLVPEEHGGLGGSFVDLVVVLEEAGRALLPGPFVSTATGATAALLGGGSAAQRAELLPGVASGTLRATLAVAEESGRFDPDGITLPARRGDGGLVLTGEKHFVMDAQACDLLVVAARTAGAGERGITLCLVDRLAPGVRVTPVRSVDLSRRICRVGLDGVRVAPERVLGAPDAGWPVLRRALEVAAAGVAAEMVGTAQEALDRTVAYVKERVQFGRAVGSFQAVKHECVDMLVAVENARSLAYYAAWAVNEDSPEARRAVAMAKAYASDMVKQVTSAAIQLHGGIGFTWEHDMHLFHRRAVAQEAAFGSAPAHRAVVAETIAS